MSDVTHILQSIEDGDPKAAEELLPLVYEELRKLAEAKMAQEKPGQTLQATALVHDAYIRLVDVEQARHWDSRGHFFSAAAEAMRRILVDSARRKRSTKHGGGHQRVAIQDGDLPRGDANELDILAVNEAIDLLDQQDCVAAQIAKLRIFGGLSVDEAGQALGVPHTTAYRQWTYAEAWLRSRLEEQA
jgi:RNA polymerase sigma factor (TIGR02999 family)